MRENPEDHRRIFDRSDDLHGNAAVRAGFDVEDPFEQICPEGALSLVRLPTWR
jgi:hypothetical protein